jgi:hypothetical protein
MEVEKLQNPAERKELNISRFSFHFYMKSTVCHIIAI